MIKTILAYLSGTELDRSVLTESLNIARLYGGHLNCLHATPDPAAIIAQGAQFDIGSSMLIASTIGKIEQQGREHTKKARETFDNFCKGEGVRAVAEPSGAGNVTAEWREKSGDEIETIIEQARFNDIVVLAGGKERTGRLPRESLGAIVVMSGRPVVLAPAVPRAQPIKTIAIAWKDAPESARAVTAAMPVLAKAGHIHVLSVNEREHQEVKCLECSESVVRQLRWHGFKADGRFVVPAGRTVPDAILETARELDTDLLVMGGYGHSRLREFVFGGFTQRILDGVDLPVLLFH